MVLVRLVFNLRLFITVGLIGLLTTVRIRLVRGLLIDLVRLIGWIGTWGLLCRDLLLLMGLVYRNGWDVNRG